jgi:DNA polymerase (family 10)
VTTNEELATIFRSIADLLDLQGERFKPEAYRRAARSIESLPEDIRQVAARGELDGIPGVGEAISEKVREYLKDGRVPYYDRLRSGVPAGVLDLMRLPGVGPKTARRFLVEFGIEGPAELGEAITQGRLANAKGFGARKLELLAKAAAGGAVSGSRTALLDAWRVANRLVADLSKRVAVDRIAVAGSLRRRRESVGDLDILVTSKAAEAVFDAFSALTGVTEVKLRGPTKETVVVDGHLQVDLRVVEPVSFGAALQYFTGSKDHNVRLRTLAKEKGLKVNEYGVTRGEERVAGTTEEEVYVALGLAWVPPEVRENHGEFELAAAGKAPKLAGPEDLRGDFHVHLRTDTTIAEVDRRLQEAGQRGWTMVGFVVPERGPHPALELLDRIRSQREGGAGGPAARLGVESPFGAPQPSIPADYVVWDLEGLKEPPSDSARGPLARFAAHLTLGSATTEATPDATRAWVEWAKRCRTGLEVSPRAAADGLDSQGVHRAETAGVPVHLTAAVRSVDDTFDTLELALGLARRGWLSPSHVINRDDPASTPARRR